MMPIENIQVLGTFPFAQFTCRLTKWPKWLDQGTTGRTRGLQTEEPFSIMQDFWQSSEAVGLSQVSKMLRQLTAQISAHYSSCKIKDTHLRLFRPDQGSHTVHISGIMVLVPPFESASANFCRGFFVQDNSGQIEIIKRVLWNEISPLTREAKRGSIDNSNIGADDTFGLILRLVLPCPERFSTVPGIIVWPKIKCISRDPWIICKRNSY